MLKPILDSLKVIIGIDGKPSVADITQHPLCIKFAHIGIFSEQRVTLFEGVDILAASVRDVSKFNYRS